ncbi:MULTISPECIES: DNA-directed RNA polymerase subunit beta' [unclassified Anaerotruncus]|uniref:DNA-directed RNA polymerase subunit beta' n=1 Tax=unclassified Anaerotruncus TaxID=2641626 RepID=UPI00033F5193|nr:MULTISPECIES: DNA-directed RNA polymerase subunit beta' [unclassified Anaerotruncus]MCI9235541.1 DNA-directed RNA polymerase subunit beta' [Anaerotruncus sp.]NCE73894.1 DNA-directed RNA polymerase subunit beta' [Anaerotruncus sp. X29]RKJ98092.1 DNA-directed RNA polymerase subunit beta' [Anaerotruncus sp. 1XD22-93]EOS63954.1 DNA-directed RNA polymerase subunit beta' [Anaerotruncus sp. G3(2012)]NBK17105.1 DNA-directed RNA polymerase subunit beta' [Anaerotruncus sp. 1XD42-93]
MEFNVFESIKIGLASPDLIREWSSGEVKKPETINYRTLKPEREGLFCEKIFGPTKDWECYCGRYKRIRYKGKVCERCGVEVTRSKVRRERMGHIELAAPVSHIWYFKGTSSRMGLLLNMSPRLLEKVLYFASYVVIDPGMTNLKKYTLLSEKEYRDLKEAYEDDFRAGMGAEAIKELLAELDLDKLAAELKTDLETAAGQKRIKLIKRLEVVEAFRQSQNRPEWMILDVVPVIPPDIRPMVQLDGGRFATSDLNDLYRRVINRNNRLKKLLELGAPDIIVRNEKRMLQEAVDALIDNGRRGRPVTGPNNRPLKSLSDMLKGKQGRFRQNLLGKRVDYSGRSVIVVGPELKMYQCGLPKEMALELFKPFVMKRLVDLKVATNIKNARKMVERATVKDVWDCLEVVIKDHPVLLNRAPTLHRLGIQAFEPVLVEGRALKLHPLVCTAYNADFDGDQMAVHVPLSAEAQAEARFLMLAANNLLKPSDGKPVAVPTQDMVLGSYYLTMLREDEKGAGKVFRDCDEALMAYQAGAVGLHAPIKVRVTREVGDRSLSKIIDATVGRIIFNDPIPQDLGYVNRDDPERMFDLEVSFLVRKKELGKIIDKCIRTYGTAKTAEVLDRIKAQGFKYSTRGAITVAVYDAVIPPEKAEYIAEAEKKVETIKRQYDRGFISDDVRYERVVTTWNDCSAKIKDALTDTFTSSNPIFMMADSGARGSMDQIKQLAGMRGLIANTSGRAIEIPIKANYREGLNILEYFNSSRGARKGLADTALRTADSGYLTRRLVDVSQEVIIREHDCGTHEGLVVCDIVDSGRVIEDFTERLIGRYVADDVVDPATGEVIVSRDQMMTEADAIKIRDAGFTEIKIRTPLNCESKIGVCAKCYGSNLANGQPVGIGEAVGIIAAQSIGEPGTQLTMRTFHTGGIASTSDITQGLPRVEELFEARKPKNSAIISHLDGEVSFEKDPKGGDFVVVTADDGERFERQVVYGSTLRVSAGDRVKKGDMITEGAIEPNEILAVSGHLAVQDYLIKEVQRTYRTQGVDINDKHIEVIVRQMMRKVKIADGGDTALISGSNIEKSELAQVNREVDELNAADGGIRRHAEGIPVLLGITKASLATESFMSAASFQETTRVLTEAAIKGKIDKLTGLKENVIIGKLVPAGTGTVDYDTLELVSMDSNAEKGDYDFITELDGEPSDAAQTV